MNTTSKYVVLGLLLFSPCLLGCGTAEFERRLEGAVSTAREAESIKFAERQKAEDEKRKQSNSQKQKNAPKISQEDLKKAVLLPRVGP